MLTDVLAKRATEEAIKRGLKIEDYMVGLKYSYAIVSGPKGREMGVAYMPVEDMSRGFARRPKIEKLPSMIDSTNMQEKSLGIALINAISQYILWLEDENRSIQHENIVDYIPGCCPEGNVVVVGNMVPLVRNLSERIKVTVVERSPKLRFGAHSDSLAPRLLSRADVAIITGATLVNDSIDHILNLVKGKKFLVGPTAGVYPPWLKGKVDLVAGTRITDIEKTKEIIKGGGGRWDFSDYCDEYIFTLDSF